MTCLPVIPVEEIQNSLVGCPEAWQDGVVQSERESN